jgi:hypothetical protein
MFYLDPQGYHAIILTASALTGGDRWSPWL